MQTKTSTNICFLLYFEEWFYRRNMYFRRSNLYANSTFFVGKNALYQQNYVASTKLVRLVDKTCMSTHQYTSEKRYICQQNSISLARTSSDTYECSDKINI